MPHASLRQHTPSLVHPSTHPVCDPVARCMEPARVSVCIYMCVSISICVSMYVCCRATLPMCLAAMCTWSRGWQHPPTSTLFPPPLVSRWTGGCSGLAAGQHCVVWAGPPRRAGSRSAGWRQQGLFEPWDAGVILSLPAWVSVSGIACCLLVCLTGPPPHHHDCCRPITAPCRAEVYPSSVTVPYSSFTSVRSCSF